MIGFTTFNTEKMQVITAFISLHIPVVGFSTTALRDLQHFSFLFQECEVSVNGTDIYVFIKKSVTNITC